MPKDQRKPCLLCGEKLSRKARYNHARFRTCVRSSRQERYTKTTNLRCTTEDNYNSDSDESINNDTTTSFNGKCKT